MKIYSLISAFSNVIFCIQILSLSTTKFSGVNFTQMTAEFSRRISQKQDLNRFFA